MTDHKPTASRTLLAAAALLATAGAAQAQTSQVTLYGRVDLGVQYSTKTAASDNSFTEVLSGGIAPSIIGFKGTEDLGGGLSAFFNLESHISADTGNSVNSFWRRQSNVGLKGDWGAVALGRQYSPALLQTAATGPRSYKEQFSGLYPYAYNQNPAGNPVNDIGIFIGNAVSYTGKFGPVGLGALVGAGEGTGKTYSVGASYTGPVIVTGAYQKIETVNDGDGTKMYSLGVGVPLGAFTIKGQWQRYRQDFGGARIGNVDNYGLGADIAWNATNTANVSVYHIKNKAITDDKTTTLVLSNDYSLSKRTTLYAQVAVARADAGATLFTSVIASGAFPDKTTTAFGVGISHNF